MNRIEFNVTTGERKVIELTPEEVAEAEARTAAEAAKPLPKTPGMNAVEQIMADPEALAALRAETLK